MLSVKDQMVEKTARELELPEDLVDLAVMWGYKDVKDYAIRSFKTVELSGFGKLIISGHRTAKRIELMEKTINSLQGHPAPNLKKLQSAVETKMYYQTKL